ncbi:uridine kinase [Salana multivorans]
MNAQRDGEKPLDPGLPGVHLLDLALAGPTLDESGTRLVCIDGLAGAGKTTLAAHLERAAHTRGLSVVVVHVDDLLAGWGGLLDVGASVVRDVVTPLRSGRPGRYRRYDWHAMAFAEQVDVPAADVVVIEGCGSAPPAIDGVAALVVCLTAPDGPRLERAVARDGEQQRPQLEAWMADEKRLAQRDRTLERADVVIDTTDSATSVVPGSGRAWWNRETGR